MAASLPLHALQQLLALATPVTIPAQFFKFSACPFIRKFLPWLQSATKEAGAQQQNYLSQMLGSSLPWPPILGKFCFPVLKDPGPSISQQATYPVVERHSVLAVQPDHLPSYHYQAPKTATCLCPRTLCGLKSWPGISMVDTNYTAGLLVTVAISTSVDPCHHSQPSPPLELPHWPLASPTPAACAQMLLPPSTAAAL